jgi:tripartite ATP-independent transporter DctP family solute receptor
MIRTPMLSPTGLGSNLLFRSKLLLSSNCFFNLKPFSFISPRSKSLGMACLLLSVLCVVGCTKKSEVIELKLGHALDSGHSVHKAMLHMGERLKEISGGTMTIKIYPSGQLGSERELIELLQIGSLAITKASASPIEGFIPEFKIFSIPYVFRDHQHFWKVIDSHIGQDLLQKTEAVRLHGLGYYDAGARSFYTTHAPVNAPDDLNGQKIRVQESATSMAMVNTLGGAATPIAWGELYTALQQGVVDGAENNPPSFYLSKHYEVARYYSLDEHTYVPDVLLMSLPIWNKLTEQQQQWLAQAAAESVVFQKVLWQQTTDEAMAALEKEGVTIVRPDKTLFAEKVKPMYQAYAGTPTGRMIDDIAAIQ